MAWRPIRKSARTLSLIYILQWASLNVSHVNFWNNEGCLFIPCENPEYEAGSIQGAHLQNLCELTYESYIAAVIAESSWQIREQYQWWWKRLFLELKATQRKSSWSLDSLLKFIERSSERPRYCSERPPWSMFFHQLHASVVNKQHPELHNF